MNRIINGYCKFLEFTIALMLAIMVILVLGNVVLRYGFNSGITMSEEISRWMFVWLTFIGAVVALKENSHLGSDMLVSRLPVAGKKACLVLGQLLMLYITWLLFDGSLTQTKLNMDVEAPVTQLPVSVFYATGLVFSVSTFLLILRQLFLVATGRIRDEDLIMVKESEEAAELEAVQAQLARDGHFSIEKNVKGSK